MGSKEKNSRMNKEKPESDAGVTSAAKDSGSRRGGKEVITDSRFTSVHSDPRFAKLSKRKAKVAIDSRFDRMFTDKRFSSSSAQIDKRGKPKKDLSQNPLKHYYRLEEEFEEKEQKAADIESDWQSKENESETEIKERFENGCKEWSDLELNSDSETLESDGDEDEDIESDGESSTDTTDSDEEDEMLLEEEDTFIQEESVPEIDKETRRLAVVNLDWSHVKAVDLYILLSSFLPKRGQILSVAVYPSEFGLKRMEEEAVHGPVGLFAYYKEKNESDEDDQIDKKKLRAYELSRLRYYYAVVDCDSIATADYLYKTCDGVEFERSSNKLDLRFIPDSMEFKHPPRDTATEAPGDYEGIDFHTRALQLSEVQLTWDEDEPQRAKTLKRKFNAEQLADLELKEFLASDEDETDEDESGDDKEDQLEKKRNKKELYRALLQSGEGSGEDDEDGQDMEVTFNTGLEDISKRILEKKDKKSETVWEAYLRKRKEKKKARKNKSKDSTDDESSDSDEEPKENLDDFFIEEPSVKGCKKGRGMSDQKWKNNGEMPKEAEASIAELELLLADDYREETGLKGYNIKPKKPKAKGKKGKEIHNEEKIPNADLDDPRFSALFTSHHYALDPTDPQFKRSAAYARQLAQKQHKGGEEELQNKSSKRASQSSVDVETENKHIKSDEMTSAKKDNYEISSMVKSLRMKSKNLQVPSTAKSGKLRAKGKKTTDSTQMGFCE